MIMTEETKATDRYIQEQTCEEMLKTLRRVEVILAELQLDKELDWLINDEHT